MERNIRWVMLPHENTAPSDAARRFGPDTAENVRRFHAGLADYAATPLTHLPGLAAALGVRSVHVKDESHRFGLNAFKALGGSYCLGRYMEGKLPGAEPVTFVTATDGNHGRGIAWAAARLGQRSVVYMPAGSSAERLENIRTLGAEASITDRNYDDTVRLAAKMAEEHGWVLVQDTAWPGYEEIPRWIMEGYTTMALEAAGQLGALRPTHIFLQAGVGAMAGAVAGFFSALYGEARPKIIIVEPETADCYYKTVLAGDGNIRTVGGSLATIMAGLACGEPCSLGWDVLRRCGDCFLSVSDGVAAEGMRLLAHPRSGDSAVISGESGAAGLGAAAVICRDGALRELKERLGLDETSRILCFSTEGDTDRESWQRITSELPEIV